MNVKDILLILFLLINIWFAIIFLKKCILLSNLDEMLARPTNALRLDMQLHFDTPRLDSSDNLNRQKKIVNLSTESPGLLGSNSVALSGIDPIPSEHSKVISGYGIFINDHERVPFIMIQSKLSEKIYGNLLKLDIFQANETDLQRFGLQKAIDYPRSRDTHIYYEGYFHSLPTNQPIKSRNPRSGAEFNKPAAPLYVRSFYESFRRKNSHILDDLRILLNDSAMSRSSEDPYQDVCGVLAKWIGDGLAFSDISVQLHYGSKIKGDELFWHSDAENSLLHLGITIHGRRMLHMKFADSPKGIVTEHLEEQNPRDIYFSSSTLMNHAPEYPDTTWESRIIALQSRILYTTSELKGFRAKRTEASWRSLTSILSTILSSNDLFMPSESDIETVMHEIENL